MTIFIYSMAILKHSIIHSKFLSLFIHFFNKNIFTTTNMFSHCHSTIISRNYTNSLKHFINCKFFCSIKPNL